MSKGWGIALILAIALFGTNAASLSVEVETEVPGWLLEETITIEGNYEVGKGSIHDDSVSGFDLGSLRNVTALEDRVELRPGLEFELLNDGEPILENGGPGAWDETLRFMSVVDVNGVYYLYYTGGSSWQFAQIGLATSDDGTNWTKYEGNPVLRCRRHEGDPDMSYSGPVVYFDGDRFHMYYSRWDGGGWDIHYANSNDGKHWTRYLGNPVIDHGRTSSEWDWNLRCGCIYKEGSTYNLIYHSNANGEARQLGIANSTDLIDWTPHPDNPLRYPDSASWEGMRTSYSTLEMADGTYRLWSSSGDSGVDAWWCGWLRSLDGVHFVDSGRAVLSPDDSTFYGHGVREPYLFHLGDRYIMFALCYGSDDEVRYGAFNVTPTELDGTFTSRAIDVGHEVRLTDMGWTVNLTWGGEVGLLLRWANGTEDWSLWEPLETGMLPVGVTGRYFQYRAEFRSPMDWMTPGLERFWFDYEVVLESLMARIDDGSWQPVNVNGRDWDVTLDLVDGDYNITVRGRDSAGDEVTIEVPVRVDLLPPVGNITLVDGEAIASSSAIPYYLEAHDTHGVVEYGVSTHPDLSDAEWRPFGSSDEFPYGGPDGEVVLYVEFKDAVGRTSETYNDSVLLDTTPPEATIVINDGDVFTASGQVVISITWTDLTDIVGMKVGTTPDVGSTGTEVTPTPSIEFDLGSEEGVRTVYLWLQDAAGWSTMVEDSITLDTSPPLIEIVLPRNHMTEAEEVRFELSVSDGFDPAPSLEWRINGGPWTAVSNETFEAALKEGRNNIEIRAQDEAGNSEITPWDMTLETDFLVSTTSWIILLVIVVVVVSGIGIWYWRRRRSTDPK